MQRSRGGASEWVRSAALRARFMNGTRYALCMAAPQRQQLVNCGSSCSPHCAQIQGAPDGAAAAFSNARRAADSSASSTTRAAARSPAWADRRERPPGIDCAARCRCPLRSAHCAHARLAAATRPETLASRFSLPKARSRSTASLAQRSQKRADVLAALQRLHQRRADDDAVDMRRRSGPPGGANECRNRRTPARWSKRLTRSM